MNRVVRLEVDCPFSRISAEQEMYNDLYSRGQVVLFNEKYELYEYTYDLRPYRRLYRHDPDGLTFLGCFYKSYEERSYNFKWAAFYTGGELVELNEQDFDL